MLMTSMARLHHSWLHCVGKVPLLRHCRVQFWPWSRTKPVYRSVFRGWRRTWLQGRKPSTSPQVTLGLGRAHSWYCVSTLVSSSAAVITFCNVILFYMLFTGDAVLDQLREDKETAESQVCFLLCFALMIPIKGLDRVFAFHTSYSGQWYGNKLSERSL